MNHFEIVVYHDKTENLFLYKDLSDKIFQIMIDTNGDIYEFDWSSPTNYSKSKYTIKDFEKILELYNKAKKEVKQND
jgi:hypothetical protein